MVNKIATLLDRTEFSQKQWRPLQTSVDQCVRIYIIV